MIFLKKFIANGFKSFANKVQIDFKNPTSGIVGPNGSGKSNIVDAIRWVLGEKSNKNLRSKISEDMLFSGTGDRQPAKFAEVILEFDNSISSLHSKEKNIVIRRKLTKGEGINEYSINGQACRLKDIQDIFLDTGLSKGSLGIISQGTVQWFVDAKPEERRTFFEDAAGIGLYAKKREDSLKQLNTTQENLNRINDITNELHSIIKKLQKQAEKVKLYSQIQNELKHLELNILVKDINFFSNHLKAINEDIDNAKNKLQVFEPSIKELTQSLNFAKSKQESADVTFEALSLEQNKLIEQINKLEIKKSSINSRLQMDISSKDIKKRSNALLTLINGEKTVNEDAKHNMKNLQESINVYLETLNSLTEKKNKLNTTCNELYNSIVETRTKIKHLVDELNNNNSMDIGTKNIIENKQALTGIKGLVRDFINVEDQYQIAINTALNKSFFNVVTEKNIDAENAINFLKSNKGGKATFLPIESIRPKSIRPEHLEIISNRDGYIGIASNLVNYDENYKNIVEFLLGNVIISQDLDSGFILSKLTYQMYRVVTLNGDLISPGGSVTGGYVNKTKITSQANPKKILDELNNQYPKINEQYISAKSELEKLNAELNEINTKISEKKFLFSKYEETLKNSENKLIKYQSDYHQLIKENDMKDESGKFDQKTIDEELTKLASKKNKIIEDLNIARNNKSIYKSQIIDQENKLNEVRFKLDEARNTVLKHQAEKSKCESIIQNAKTKINQTYKMTIEFAMSNFNDELPMSDKQARETIIKLQDDISRLGNINLDSLSELESNQKRYDEILTQKKDLEAAKSDIEKIIAHLDEKAKIDFSNCINKVNDLLPNMFKRLFGGGTCKVEYVDPQNILTSGLEVIAAPLGKKVTRLSLLSGGEKSLVALSILFSVLQIKNFPLIILDEAESALDPANVERFASIVKNSSENTQFIVITHRPGTMEKCDTLFGVTMQPKGISNIYKVELTQAQNKYASNE